MAAVESQTPQDETPPAPRPRHRLRKFLFCLVLTGSVFLYFLPAIASRVFQQPEAMAALSRKLPAQVKIGTAELAWQSPVKITDMQVKTPSGKPVAQIDTVKSERSLWEIFTNPDQPLNLTFDGLRYSVTVTPSENPTTLDSLIWELQKMKITRPSRAMIVKLTNSGVDFRDAEGEILGSWNGIDATYEYSPGPVPSQTVTATIPQPVREGEPANPGPPMASLNGSWTLNENHADVLHISVSSDRLGLQPFEPLLAPQFGPGHGLVAVSGSSEIDIERHPETGWTLNVASQLPPLTPQDAVGATVHLEAVYHRGENSLTVPRLQIEGPRLAAALQGTVKQVNGPQLVSLTGHLHAKGTALSLLFPPEVRDHLQVADLSVSDLSVQGALQREFPEVPPLSLSTTVRWGQLWAWGIQSDSGEMQISLRNGILAAIPVNVPLNGGKLHRIPAIDLRTDSPVALFDEGLIFENVLLTEQACRDWLKYISPALANSTTPSGTISLGARAAAVPLRELETADLAGALTIHQAEVRPGPLAGEILVSIDQIRQLIPRAGRTDLSSRPMLTVENETIPFRLYQGRIYHERFQFLVGKVPVTTTGSVGLDDSLDMLMTISIPSQWTDDAGPVLSALAGEQIPMPVGGSLNQPRIDASGLADFGKRAGVKAGIGLLEKVLERRAAPRNR